MPNASSGAVAREHDSLSADLNLALVVSGSPITRIVVARIAERAGLKAIEETPENAATVLLSRRPGMVLLDGGAENCDCDCLLDSLAAQRVAAGMRVPFVVLLSNVTQPGRMQTDGPIDTVVAKPVTPERLLPLIMSTLDRLRD